MKNNKDLSLIFIVGNRKNAGKTTVLNNIVKDIYEGRETENVSLLTIGWDGESEDRFFGNKKPEIMIYPGLSFVTASNALIKANFQYDILHSFSFSSTAGKYYFCKSKGNGFIELIGPENNSMLNNMISFISDFGMDKVIIDGALDRLTHISSFKNSEIYYVFSPLSSWSEDKIIKEFKTIMSKFSIKSLNKNLPKMDNSTFLDLSLNKISDINAKNPPEHYSFVFIKGALTENIFNKFDANCKFIIEDLTKCFLTDEKKFKRVMVINRLNIGQLYLNPNANYFWNKAFEKRIYHIAKEYFPKIRISDVLNLSNTTDTP